MNKKNIIFAAIILLIISVSYGLYYGSKKGKLLIETNSINGYCQSNKYENLQLKGILSDKYKVKEWIKNNFPDIEYSKVIYKTKNPEAINKFVLPDNFVMKSTSGAGMTKIVKNNKYDKKELIKLASNYLNTYPSTYGYRKIPFLGLEEPQYDYNDPQIIFEEYLGDNLYEFRILLIKGKIVYYEYIIDGENKFYDSQKNKMDFSLNKKLKEKMEINTDKIDNFCKDFYQKTKIEFARVDFYKKEDDFIFGEITFTPDNCRKSYNYNYEKDVYKNYIKT